MANCRARGSNSPMVLRELPLTSVTNSNNINGLNTGSPLRTSLPESPMCSPVVYLYGTANVARRRLDLDATPISPPAATSTPVQKRPLPRLAVKRQLRSNTPSPVKKAVTPNPIPPVTEEPAVSVDEVLLWIQSSKRQKTAHGPIRGHLEKRLRSLTANQLAAVMEEVIGKHPHLEQDILDLLPEPDISDHLSHLSDLLHNIYRSLPRQRLCSSRSPFSYRRVKSHIFAFKKFCIQQGRHFLACETWQTAIEYAVSAWQHASYLPKWECPVHNKLKAGCLRGLASICVEALDNGSFVPPYLNQLRKRLQLIKNTSPEFEACLRKLDLVSERTPSVSR